MKDLFGNNVKQPDPAEGKFKAIKKRIGYRSTDSDFFSCRNCIHLRKKQITRTHYKCALIGDSASKASDVTLSSVCREFERQEANKTIK